MRRTNRLRVYPRAWPMLLAALATLQLVHWFVLLPLVGHDWPLIPADAVVGLIIGFGFMRLRFVFWLRRHPHSVSAEQAVADYLYAKREAAPWN